MDVISLWITYKVFTLWFSESVYMTDELNKDDLSTDMRNSRGKSRFSILQEDASKKLVK